MNIWLGLSPCGHLTEAIFLGLLNWGIFLGFFLDYLTGLSSWGYLTMAIFLGSFDWAIVLRLSNWETIIFLVSFDWTIILGLFECGYETNHQRGSWARTWSCVPSDCSSDRGISSWASVGLLWTWRPVVGGRLWWGMGWVGVLTGRRLRLLSQGLCKGCMDDKVSLFSSL